MSEIASDARSHDSYGWHRCSGLLAFLDIDVVRALLERNPYQLQRSGTSISDLLASYREEFRSLVPYHFPGIPKPLPMELEERASLVEKSDLFKEHYSRPNSVSFGMVPIDRLLTPQFDVDTQFIDQVRRTLEKKPPNVSSAFSLLFGEEKILPPLVLGQTVTFSSPRRGLFCDETPKVTALRNGGYDVRLMVRSRPNFCYVAVVGGKYLVLANGLHRVLALYLEGMTEVPCLWEAVETEAEVGINDPSSLHVFRQLLSRGPRPALVIDFLNTSLATPLLHRDMDLVLRISFASELLTAPALRPCE